MRTEEFLQNGHIPDTVMFSKGKVTYFSCNEGVFCIFFDTMATEMKNADST